jgi:predicted kinase
MQPDTTPPFAVAYLPFRIIRHVMRDEIDVESARRYVNALASLIEDLTVGGERYHLLIDARRKSFTSLDAMRIVSKGFRGHLVAEQIDRKALVSEQWFGSGDADGIPSFAKLADGWCHLTGNASGVPSVVLIAGSTAAGKTTFARVLAEELTAVRFSIDDWMAHLHLPDRPVDAGFEWHFLRIQRCEAVMRNCCEQLYRIGTPIILDLGFSTLEHRTAWLQWARRTLGADPWIYWVDVEAGERWRRVERRNAAADEPFRRVSRETFESLESRFEPPTEDEAKLAIVRW